VGGLAVLAVAAGYGVYGAMPSNYLFRGTRVGPPAWSEPVRLAAGAGVALAFWAVVVGLARLVRSQPAADRGLVVMAWAGWTLFGVSLAVGVSLWDMAYTTLNSDTHIGFDWGIVRGLIAGVVWAGIVVAGLTAWRRAAGSNRSLQPATSA
jgi:hypothetical protein